MTKEELLKSKEKYIWLTKSEEDSSEFTEHFNNWDFFHTKSPSQMGQYFVYEVYKGLRYDSTQIQYASKVSYPKLGIYLNALPCDQTIEVEWVDYRRTWEWRCEYEYTHNDKLFTGLVAELPTTINSLPLWGDSILVYGLWDTKPDWKQIRQAYERSWYFHRTKDELRNIQLDRIFN